MPPSPFSVLIMLFYLVFSSLSPTLTAQTAIQPKYAPSVISIIDANQYFREHTATVYWKLSPFYLPQLTDSSCSVATATMIVNAALSQQPNAASLRLATQDGLLKRVNNINWIERVKSGGDGVNLAQLKTLMSQSLHAYGIHNFTIDLVYTKNKSKETVLTLHKALMDSEVKGQSFIIANFNQKFFTAAESIGHFAPIGAYDRENRRVLIMDPDRSLYEPYWVPETTLLAAMATLDTDSQNYRGYLVIHFHKPLQ